jgi:hypothetical protein
MTRTTCFMTSRKDNKIVRLDSYRAQKELNSYVKTHLEMERAWQFACELLRNTNTKGLDPINVHLSLFKLMILKLQHHGYDYHSLRRILHNVFNEE